MQATWSLCPPTPPTQEMGSKTFSLREWKIGLLSRVVSLNWLKLKYYSWWRYLGLCSCSVLYWVGKENYTELMLLQNHKITFSRKNETENCGGYLQSLIEYVGCFIRRNNKNEASCQLKPFYDGKLGKRIWNLLFHGFLLFLIGLETPAFSAHETTEVAESIFSC